MSIRTLIVDDEPLAREKLRGFLDKEEGFEVVGECRDGAEALMKIEEEHPDLVFLDIQMPEMNGFDVLENLDPEHLPTIVFTTAFDEYALKAFEVHAIDYLLKPFDRERFRQALEQVRVEQERREVDRMKSRLEALLDDLETRRPQPRDRLVVKSGGRVVFVRLQDIDWIDAAGNYVKIHTAGDTLQLRETMTRIEKRLDPDRFLRIHRSTIVNIERIRELEQQFHGDYVVVLDGGQRLTLSRSYRDRVHQLLEAAF